jgi:PH domain
MFRKQTITTKTEGTVVQGRTSISQSSELIVSTYTGSRHLTVKVPTRVSFLEQRHGYLLKKSSKSRFGISVWNKRYFVLLRGKLVIHTSKKEYLLGEEAKAKKNIDMRDPTSVCFHYDRDAPVKSKKLNSKQSVQD